MTRTDSLILLVHSLSKSEKRAFRLGRKETDYIILYDIIEKTDIVSSQELKSHYEKKCKSASFNVAVSYLYKILLDTLLTLREDQDSYYNLFNRIMKARILFEKSLFTDALDLLDKVKKEAAVYENPIALLYASRIELEYLMFLNMPDISEPELIKKQFQISELLKKIRIINEQSSLYELLKHRMIYKGNVRSAKEKEEMSDLVFAEMSLTASSKDSFESQKLHQLFQSNYLMSTGDQKSAYQSFRELNNLFERNQQFWSNPPFYYVSVIEGILDNLRSMRLYDKMPYFIERLKNIEHPSVRFQTHVGTLIFLYELVSLLDTGDFQSARKMMDQHRESVLTKTEQINIFQRAEISLYTALVYIGLHDYKRAKKMLVNELILNNNIYIFPIYRTIRIVNLIIHYELNDMEYIQLRSRSIKREISKEEKIYRVEHLILDFLNKGKQRLIRSESRKRLWQKLEPELEEIRNSVFEKQLLKCFDFTAWIEAKVCKVPLSEVLEKRLS